MRASALLLCIIFAGAEWSTAQAQTALNGIYVALRNTTPLGVPEREFMTFYPDGRVYHDDPDEGMAAPLDWADACRNTQCGSYRVGGNTLVVRWSSGEERRFEIEPGGVLKPAGSVRRFRPLAALDDLRLDGIYAVKNSRGEVTVGITFSREGEFREYNLLPYTSWVMRGDSRERQRQVIGEGFGRYSIRRNTLELRYSNGLVTRHMISVPPGVPVSGNPATISVNRTDLTRAR
jgi:hypothetical protein